MRLFQAVQTVPEFEALICVMETAVPPHLPIADLRHIPHFPLPRKFTAEHAESAEV
ncbi:MAG: hypothetical protein IPJ90_12070 [Anaerolineaceae bacterium]|nr:hypothetical protein [Anaerolineaceae bacterium]